MSQPRKLARRTDVACASGYRSSRVLCAARILNIVEGADEIQAQVIARRLLGE